MPETDSEDGQGGLNMVKISFFVIFVLSFNPFLLRPAETSCPSYSRGFWDYSEGFGMGVTQGSQDLGAA